MIKQKKLAVTLETITPMFLAGGNKDVPELRAPSIVGALRYWTRAAIGGVLGDKNLDALKQAEEEVWGSTNGTGAVRIQLIPKLFEAEHIKALPHKPAEQKAANTKFCAIPAGLRFQVVLRQNTATVETWDMAIASLLLMTAHGGIGRRARRGWGSLMIIKAEGNDSTNSEWHKFTRAIVRYYADRKLSYENWNVYRQWSLKYAQEVANNLCQKLRLPALDSNINFPTSYPIATYDQLGTPTCTKPKIYPINTNTVGNGSIAAIKDFGTKEHNFKPGTEFGDARQRWSSPLWVRVLPVSSPEIGYVLGMTTLKSKGHSGQADYDRLQKFVEQF